MKFPERIKRHPCLSGGALAFVLTVGGLETAGYVSNWADDVPAGSCVSPFVSSPTYQDKDSSILWQTDTGIDTTGVVVQGILPKGADGIQASFEAPEWESRAGTKTRVACFAPTIRATTR